MSPASIEATSTKGEENNKHQKENTGKKKCTSNNVMLNDSKNDDTLQCNLLENMETEVQSPLKTTVAEKDKGRSEAQKISQSTSGRMDPPSLPLTPSSSQSLERSPDKNVISKKRSGVCGSSHVSNAKKTGGSVAKGSHLPSPNIVQAPTTSATVGGPSLPNRSSIGSTNQDSSSFRTYR